MMRWDLINLPTDVTNNNTLNIICTGSHGNKKVRILK